MEVVRGPSLSNSSVTERMAAISPARRSAFEILQRVDAENAFASVLLAAVDSAMRDDDRALCHELVLGTLRRRLWLDRTLEHFADRNMADLDLPVRLALELGLYQLRFLTRIPPSAAVNESVSLVRRARLKSATGFVNAVLRRATREPDYDPAARIGDQIERTAIATSHPRWLIERWTNDFGFAEAEKLASANNQQPPLVFRLTARSHLDETIQSRIFNELSAAGGEVISSVVAKDAWRLVGATSVARRLAGDGLIYFQDEASQMIAHLLEVRKGDRVLDIAAAPGSKATHLAAIARGATIIAGDIYEHRVRTMRDLAKNQNTQINFVIHDGTRSLPFPKGSFDRVLLDAPCSGTGTLRRNPEIRWRLTSADIKALSTKQKVMLTNAAQLVGVGGRLIYSTCSMEREENEVVAATFASQYPDFNRIRLDGLRDLQTEDGEIRTWPHRQDVDGFFVAAFERTH